MVAGDSISMESIFGQFIDIFGQSISASLLPDEVLQRPKTAALGLHETFVGNDSSWAIIDNYGQ